VLIGLSSNHVNKAFVEMEFLALEKFGLVALIDYFHWLLAKWA
jgi:hypothetical protein